MAKKIAIFVEGLTEQEFTIKLLQELAGSRGIEFEIQSQHQGILSFTELRSNGNTEIHVLVANCCTDGQVKTQIRDRYNHLKSLGYVLIVGLRDVHPFTHNEIPNLQNSLLTGLPVGTVPIHMHLAIMETEAWFLEEISHFSRLPNQIPEHCIINNGFDYANTRAWNLVNPATILDNIYKCAGMRYKKQKKSIQRTVAAISYEELYINTQHRAPSLREYVTSLEACLN